MFEDSDFKVGVVWRMGLGGGGYFEGDSAVGGGVGGAVDGAEGAGCVVGCCVVADELRWGSGSVGRERSVDFG